MFKVFFQLTDVARTYLCGNTPITIQSGHRIPVHEIRSFANYMFNNSSASQTVEDLKTAISRRSPKNMETF